MQGLSIHQLLFPKRSRNQHLEAELRRYGHTLGLAVTAVLDGNRILKSEGNSSIMSMSIVSELLDKYVAENNKTGSIAKAAEVLRHEKDMQSQTIEFLLTLSKLDLPSLISKLVRLPQKHAKAQAVFKNHGVYIKSFSSNVSGHAFYLVYNKEYVAVSNRGYTSDFSNLGIQLYRLKPGAAEKINKMNPIAIAFKSVEDLESFLQELKEGEAIEKFSFKPQKIGTCSLVNIKSLLKPMLHLLGDTPDQIKKEYKDFTTWLREYEIKQLIKKYLIAEQQRDHDLKMIYENLLLSYIRKNTLNQSIFGVGAEKLIGFLERGVTRAINRKDLKYYSLDPQSKERRSRNIMIIYKNLSNLPRFDTAFEELAPAINKKLLEPKYKDISENLIKVELEELNKSKVTFISKLLFGAKLIAACAVMITYPICYLLLFTGYACFSVFSHACYPQTVEATATFPTPTTTTVNSTMSLASKTKSFIISKIYSSQTPTLHTAAAPRNIETVPAKSHRLINVL
jgi:hypothetical protein